MSSIRPPAVAGMFYPSDPKELHQMVTGFLAEAAAGPVPKALIAPHAGYIYSGPIAASAYKRIEAAKAQIQRVVLLGPSHRVPFLGLAVSSADTFRTPLGDIPLDTDAIISLLELPQVTTLNEAHSMEHSLEVHLPFLQETLGDFVLVPLVVGDASADQVAEVLEQVWGGPETLIVISSDLSHYQPYEVAQRQDSATSHAIESLKEDQIKFDDACGRIPVSGLLRAARRHGLQGETIDLRNSGDTAGSRDQVVGYGAYVFS